MKIQRKAFLLSLIMLMSFCPKIHADNDDSSAGSDDENTNKYYYHDVYNAGKDSGYSKYYEIDDDDMHYGWKLGKFEVSGFVGNVKDKSTGIYTFFKNYNSKMQLDFILEQDINALNGDDSMYVCEDKNGYDEEFNVPKGDIEHGCLIVSKVDYQNNVTQPIFYGDYLVGVEKDQNTAITLLEEGDYTVVLDYEIRHDRLHIPLINVDTVPEYGNYRIKFSFSVRNSNCMVFIRDAVTNSDLPDKAIAENGFYVDLANSHYLNIYVKRSTIAANGYSLTEDTRFNAMISEGTIIDKDGLYEITVKNESAKNETVKKVYVGKDPIMKAYIVTGYSLEEIHDFLQNGAIITDTGEIVMPLPTATPTPTPEPTVTPTETPTPSPIPTATPTSEAVDPSQSEQTNLTIPPTQTDTNNLDRKLVGICAISFVVVLGGLVLIVLRHKSKRKMTNEDCKDISDQMK